jgi:putative RecB family exonuclease
MEARVMTDDLTDAGDPVDEYGNPILVDVPAEFEPGRPPLIDAQGRVRLSFSRIDTYRTCPRQFRYRYIDRLPGKPAPALSFGSSIHDALERFYDRKLPVEPSEDELVDMLYESWDSSGFGDLSREEQMQYYRQGQDVLRRYHRKVTGSYRLPVATEAWFELPFEDAVVVGSIDRVDSDEDGSLRIVDYKTNKRVKDRSRVAGSLQLAIYALACEHLYGELPVSVALDFVVPGVEIQVPIGDIDLDAARRAVADTAAAVKAQQFEATPMRLCDWCDQRAVCPAWVGEDPSQVLGDSVLELASLRRSLRRDVERMRALEEGVDRLRFEVAARDSDLPPLVERDAAAATTVAAAPSMPPPPDEAS